MIIINSLSRQLMKFIILLVSLVIMVVMAACSAQKAHPDAYAKSKIIFGSGGGFTGAVTTYCLTEEGQLFKKASMNADWEAVVVSDKKSAQQCFSIISTIDFNRIILNQPGNRYRFIEYKSDTIDHKVLWGRNKDEVPNELLILYKLLNDTIETPKQ